MAVCPPFSMVTNNHATGLEKTLLGYKAGGGGGGGGIHYPPEVRRRAPVCILSICADYCIVIA